VAGVVDRLGGAHRAGLGDDRHAAGGLVDDGLDDQAPLRAAHRGELAGGAAGDDALDSAVDVAVDQATQRARIDLSVRRERRCANWSPNSPRA
jgi:hypothetical protein